jgi:hypothetical protein
MGDGSHGGPRWRGRPLALAQIPAGAKCGEGGGGDASEWEAVSQGDAPPCRYRFKNVS